MKSWISNKVKIRIAQLTMIGLSADHVHEWGDKWLTKRKNAKTCNIEFSLTFEQYVNKAVDANITNPNMIGRHVGNFALGRVGDIGGYTEDNCRFITVEQNSKEMKDNGGVIRSSLKQKNRTKETHPYLADRSVIRKTHTAETQEWVRIRADKIRGRVANTDAGIASATGKNSKYFRLTGPDGIEYVGHNICKFCEGHADAPNQSNVSAVCRGDKLSSKGWTGTYINKIEYDEYPGIKQTALGVVA